MTDLDVSAQVQKTNRCHFQPLLTPQPLTFVALISPNDQVNAIAANAGVSSDQVNTIVANAGVSTAVDKKRRNVVGTSIQRKKDHERYEFN